MEQLRTKRSQSLKDFIGREKPISVSQNLQINTLHSDYSVHNRIDKPKILVGGSDERIQGDVDASIR